MLEPTPRACSSSALPRAEVRSPEPSFQIHSNPSPPPSFFSVHLKAHSHLLQSCSHPTHPRPVSPTPLSPQHLPVSLLTHNTLSLLHLCSLQPPLSSARLPTPYLRSTTAAELPAVPPTLTFLLILQHLLPLTQAQTSSSFHSHTSSHFPGTWHMEGCAGKHFESPNAAYTCPKSAEVNSEAIKNKMHPRRIG